MAVSFLDTRSGSTLIGMHNPAARVDEVWGDPADWTADGEQWAYSAIVRSALNRRVTGNPDLTALAWFFEMVGQAVALPVGRVLVLGCGGGALERDLARSGWVREILAVDLSPRVIDYATAAAARDGLDMITYRVADMNELDLGNEQFDIIFGVSAIHHCANLEGIFAEIAEHLSPGGWLYLDEYIGPTRFQWTEAQVRHVNRLLDLLPDRLTRTAKGLPRHNFQRVSPEEIAVFDPSEAVRSADIVAALGERFKTIERRNYGGTLLQLLLSQIAQNFDGDDGPEYLQRLIEAEDRLIQSGALGQDFSVILAKPIR